MGLLDGELAEAIHGAVGFLTSDATLEVRQRTSGEYDPTTGGFTGSNSTHSCEAIVTEFSDYYVLNGLVAQSDRKVLVPQKSLPDGVEPGQGDAITVGGEALKILGVSEDPAGALWTLRAARES